MRSLLTLDVLTKENIVEPMRDIRRALLEADVSVQCVNYRFAFSVWFHFAPELIVLMQLLLSAG